MEVHLSSKAYDKLLRSFPLAMAGKVSLAGTLACNKYVSSRSCVGVAMLPRMQRRKRSHSARCFMMRSDNSKASGEGDTFSKYSGYVADSSEAELMKEYNASRIASLFTRRPLLLLRRISQITSSFATWFALRYFDSLLGRSQYTFKERARELRALLVQLGPAFVKIAQAVSSRPDVVPPAYTDELSLLQDRIAPFDTDIAMSIIEEELGVPLDLLFSEITPEPVAAASLGQVYQARLRPNSQVVAVKVQRPGVRAAITLDIFILRFLAGIARKAGRFNTDLQAVVDEWASSLFQEMDYEAEARNGTRFRKLFGNLPEVVIPKMYPELTSTRVLVMEWVEGQKLSEVNDLHLVEVGVYCSLTQLLDSGFYHADPHPGNLLRTYDGKLAYLDFGMMGEIKQNLRNGLIEACLHLVNRDFQGLAEDFVTLGFLPPLTSEMSNVSMALTGVFQQAVSKGVRNISFGDLSGDLGKTMYRFKFRIPSYFSLVIRSLTVLEGVALSKDPNYKVLSSSYPWIARKVLTDNSPQLRSTLRALLYKGGSFQIDRLESLITEASQSTTAESLTRDDNRAENHTQLSLRYVLRFTLSDEGDFVRDILLDEIVKGIDALNRATFDAATTDFFVSLPESLPVPPQIMEDEDIENLNTFLRLTSLLTKDMNSEAESGNLVSKNKMELMKDASVFLQQLISFLIFSTNFSAISELPFPAQQRLLQLPPEFIGRMTSRMLARTIRSSIPIVMSEFA